jgi:hypothetical protein
MGIEKYLPKELSKENQGLIIENIIKEVEEKSSARVGFHAEKILNYSLNKVPYNIISKIEASTVLDTRYKSRPHPTTEKDYEIIKNPDYKKKTFWSKYPFVEKVLLVVIAAALSLLANLYLSKTSKQSQQLKDIRQDSLIKDVGDSLKSFQKRINN